MPDDLSPEQDPDFNGSGSRIQINNEESPVAASEAESANESRILMLWERLSQLGLAETTLRLGTHLLSFSLVLMVVWLMREFYTRAQVVEAPREAAFAAAAPTATPTNAPPALPALTTADDFYISGIPRLAVLHTTIPTRPRTKVITYTVKKGDTVFGIAEKFGLKPETIMWGNYYVLADNPHALTPGQELNIMPTDGTYHRWSAGEGLNGVAQGYGVDPEAIVNWESNNLNPETLGNWSNPNIEPGTFLFVPGGERAFVSWSAPFITREDPAVARAIGPGSCGTIYEGAVGYGSFIWPSAHHFLSGFDYTPSTNHFGIDIDGDLGEPMWSSDSGVVVYAGWNNFGYGNMVVIDHGNDWQTLYAHMDTISVYCGQSVGQGTVIGTIGTTGKSSGPHIHFELQHLSYGKVNPWDFLPP